MASKYMALSYCWGCQEAISELRRRHCRNYAKETLEDAVQVAISLGSELIWIDSSARSCGSSCTMPTEAGKMSSPTEVRARVVHDWDHHRGGRQSHYTHYSKWVDPVDKRAWTLQERLLSTRHVAYTSGELQWGCQMLKDCECGQPLYGKSDEPLEPEDQWFAILEEYSTRSLSMHTDKLTALAGIARKMSIDLKRQQYAASI
ncbi:hypothetical protein PG994_003666 [Apiospora phragmitis]|uniref:Heterokaryon incompatibility domain-containing protein n=1 Tax=Apiospora phragmitis TaxID=2905665 RepID=A0ABR1VYS5_9PEZI